MATAKRKTIDPRLDDWPRRIAKPDLERMSKTLAWLEDRAGDRELQKHLRDAWTCVEKALARIG